MHGRFLGTSRSGVDADVAGDEIRLLVRMRALVLGYQAARARFRQVVILEELVLGVGFLVFPLRLRVRVDVGLFLGQQLVERLAGLLPQPRWSRIPRPPTTCPPG